MKDIRICVHLTDTDVILPEILTNAARYAIEKGVKRVNVYARPTEYTLYHGRARDCKALREFQRVQ